jgi:RNA polymerase-interacting CarD/CdnL/TRCF family regulator
MGKMFNKVVKAINKGDIINQIKAKIDKTAKGITLNGEETKELNGIRADYLTKSDEIARELGTKEEEWKKERTKYEVKFYDAAIDFAQRELDWWNKLKAQINEKK